MVPIGVEVVEVRICSFFQVARARGSVGLRDVVKRRLSGLIRRKKRQEFERYLNSTNSRIRSLALEIQAEHAIARALNRLEYDLDDAILESIDENNDSQPDPSDIASSDSMPF